MWQIKRSSDEMEDNTEKCSICLADFEDTEDVRYAMINYLNELFWN